VIQITPFLARTTTSTYNNAKMIQVKILMA